MSGSALVERTPGRLNPIIILKSPDFSIRGTVKKTLLPAAFTALASLILVTAVISGASGNPLALARIGTQYSEGDPAGTQGYDGQFVYFMARNPDPEQVREHLDAPAYRYQRILLPILARWLSFSQLSWIPWAIPAVNIFVHVLAVWALAVLLRRVGESPWYALIYGLWVGLLLPIRLDLPEPLAYGLIIFGILAEDRDLTAVSWMLWGAALFAKEVVLLFIAARLIMYILNRDWLSLAGMAAVSLVPYALFQAWLFHQFGQLGLGSGGAMATGFEWIPFRGLFLIGRYNLVLLVIYLVIFGPFLIYPALDGIWRMIKSRAEGTLNMEKAAYGLHGLSFLFLPFSTYREPGGLLRYADGLILAVILTMSKNGKISYKKYLPLLLILNLFLLEV